MKSGPDYKNLSRLLFTVLVTSTSLLEATIPLMKNEQCRAALRKVVADCRKVIAEAGTIL